MAKIKIRTKQPWISYSGSPIAQNFAETQDRGYIVWDIESPTNFKATEKNITQLQPFITLDFKGSIEKTLKNIDQYPNNSRFRIKSDIPITQVDINHIFTELKTRKNASEVTWKIEAKINSNVVKTKSITLLKQDLHDPSSHIILLKEFFKNTQLEKKEWETIEQLTKKYLTEILSKDISYSNNPKWSIKKLQFDNTFGFGKDNIINFDKFSNITGIFGPNTLGKSSILGTIMYCLYNQTDRGAIKNQDIVNIHKDFCSATTTFETDGKYYQITRRTDKKNKKNGDITSTSSLVFKEVDSKGNDLINFSDTYKNEVEPLIRSKVGLAEDFLMTSFASQGEMLKFIKEGATKRKSIINKFLGLNIFEQMCLLAKNDSDDVKSQMKALTDKNWDVTIQQNEKNKIEYKNIISNTDDELSILRSELQRHQIELSSLTGNEKIITKSDISNQEEVIKSLSNNLNDRKTKLSTLDTDIQTADEKINKINDVKIKFPVEQLKEKLAEQHRLEKTLTDIKHQYEKEQNILNQQKNSVKKLNIVPCGDQFPSCMFIKDSHLDKLKIDNQTNMVNNILTEVENIQKSVKKIADDKLQEKINKYNELDDKIIVLKRDISIKSIEKGRIEAKIQDLEQEILSANSVLENLKSKITDKTDEIDAIKEKIKITNGKIAQLDANRVLCAEKIGKTDSEIEHLKKERDLYNDLRSKWKIYELYLQAVGKKGIPNQILSSQIPAINLEIGQLLSGITKYTIELQVEDDTNDLDVYINYGGLNRRVIETGSGMEKLFAGTVIRIALLKASCNIPTADSIFIDEGFDGLDNENKINAKKLFELLKKYFKNIVLISHDEEIKEMADFSIEVFKDNGFSKVSNE